MSMKRRAGENGRKVDISKYKNFWQSDFFCRSFTTGFFVFSVSNGFAFACAFAVCPSHWKCQLEVLDLFLYVALVGMCMCGCGCTMESNVVKSLNSTFDVRSFLSLQLHSLRNKSRKEKLNFIKNFLMDDGIFSDIYYGSCGVRKECCTPGKLWAEGANEKERERDEKVEKMEKLFEIKRN